MLSTTSTEINFQAGINRILIDEVDFWIRSGDTYLEFTGYYDLGDPFPGLVSLVDKVKRGEEASIDWCDLFRFTRFAIDVSDADFSGRVQVYAMVDTSDEDRKSGVFRVECERVYVVSVLGNLLNDLADHPDFVHQYFLGWDYLDDDIVGNVVDKFWDEMVDRGEVEDDYEAEMAFYCQYAREHVPIPEVEVDRIDLYLNMLRTVDISGG